MINPSISIVGGDFNNDGGRASSVVHKLTYALEANHVFNGGYIDNLPEKLHSDLNIWMVNVSNEEKKEYPKKKAGSCLIVSKVVRSIEGEHKFFQPLTRIFRMNANAVIAIEKNPDSGEFIFSLVDALGNIWVTTDSIIRLADTILNFYFWSSKQVRKSSEQALVTPHSKYVENLDDFLWLVRKNAQNIMTKQGDRFFGNCSTRCMSTFPSSRLTNGCMVSGRNSSKEGITVADMVYAWSDGDDTVIQYCGDRKPSVDTPVQLALYQALPKINYMIHGHAFYDGLGFPTTAHYCPCGDMREVDEILNIVSGNASGFVINLKGHGFLIGASTLDTLSGIVDRHTPTMIPFRSINDII